MKTKFEYIHFVKVAEKPKTSVWECRNNNSNDALGRVQWFGRWRQYCFHPAPTHSFVELVFNVGCLDDIAAFIRSLPRKTGPKPKGA